jgi:serine/threonine protein kinase
VNAAYDETSKSKVAVKAESVSCSDSQLQNEWDSYQSIQYQETSVDANGHDDGRGMVAFKPIDFDSNDRIKMMVMPLLQHNLQYLFNLCNKNFSMQTILMIGIALIKRVKHYHESGLVHRVSTLMIEYMTRSP